MSFVNITLLICIKKNFIHTKKGLEIFFRIQRSIYIKKSSKKLSLGYL